MNTPSATAAAAAAPARAHSRRRKPLRIAVASSGLGHVRRGIETWAEDLAGALRRAGQDVTLFRAAAGDGGSGRADRRLPGSEVVLPCWRRTDPSAERWVRRLRRCGGWRYGFGSGYQAEETSFALRLWRRVRRDYDILNVQDPWLALLLDRLHRARLSRPRVILAHGTEEPAHLLRRYACLQHLAPCYRDDWDALRPPGQAVFAVPNFVDTERFRPGGRREARAAWGLPPDDLIVLSVAAIKRHHKRVDALLEEFARFAPRAGRPATLVVAGAREAETDAVIARGRALLGERVRFLEGVGRDRMPELYRAADVFALASLHEMMPIAVLEALASGLPVACNDTPTLLWMVGPAGCPTDLSTEGALAAQMRWLTEDPRRYAGLSVAARLHAEDAFSERAVIPQYIAMYERAADGDAAGNDRR